MEVEIESHTQEFIVSLDLDTRAKYRRMRGLLEKFGNRLPMPYSKKIVNGIFELRIRGRQEVRLFYVFYNNKAYILHGFIKKTQAIPPREIMVVMKRKRSLTIL